MTTFTAFGASELAAWNSGAPFLIGNHVLERYATLPQWRVADDPTAGIGPGNAIGWGGGGTNVTDNTSYPVWHLWDRSGEAVSRPATSLLALSATNVALIGEWTPSTADIDAWDTAIILGHNFDTFGNAFDAYFQVTNDNTDADFASSMDYFRWGPTAITINADGRRLSGLSFTFGDRQRVTNGRYWRLLLSLSSGSFSTLPEISELWVGRARQLSYFPDRPFDAHKGHAEAVDHKSESGQMTRYFRYSKQAVFNMTLRSGGADRNGHNQNTELEQWYWTDSEGGKPSILVMNGSSEDDAEPYLVLPGPDFSLPQLGPFERAGAFDFEESAPFYREEVQVT